MNESDHIYGARSGIQKAIRRGDLDLAHTCFEVLWSEDLHRNWLFWRSTSLVLEEAWQMAGELAELQASKSKEKKDWRKFIYRLTLATKSKDASPLFFWIQPHGWDIIKHPEMEEMKAWVDLAKEENPKSVALEMADVMHEAYSKGTKERQLSEYERSAIDIMRDRTKMGGGLGDRQICMSSMVMLFLRGLDRKRIDEDVKHNARRWVKANGRSKPRTVNMPWYAFDKHTLAGKIAFGIFMRNKAHKYSVNENDYWSMWFWLESSKTPKYLLSIPESRKNPTCFDSIWWLPWLNRRLQLSVHTPRQAVETWKNGMRQDTRNCVEWILEKRDGGE